MTTAGLAYRKIRSPSPTLSRRYRVKIAACDVHPAHFTDSIDIKLTSKSGVLDRTSIACNTRRREQSPFCIHSRVSPTELYRFGLEQPPTERIVSDVQRSRRRVSLPIQALPSKEDRGTMGFHFRFDQPVPR